MTEANDMISLYPNLNLINKDAPTVMGQLQPYLAWKKKNVDAVNTEFASEIKASFADEILSPTDAEVKSAVDSLFAERGIRATAKDYAKYEDIFSNLKKQEASRDIEIENNTLTLSDVADDGSATGSVSLASTNFNVTASGSVADSNTFPTLNGALSSFSVSAAADLDSDGLCDSVDSDADNDTVASDVDCDDLPWCCDIQFRSILYNH